MVFSAVDLVQEGNSSRLRIEMKPLQSEVHVTEVLLLPTFSTQEGSTNKTLPARI